MVGSVQPKKDSSSAPSSPSGLSCKHQDPVTSKWCDNIYRRPNSLKRLIRKRYEAGEGYSPYASRPSTEILFPENDDPQTIAPLGLDAGFPGAVSLPEIRHTHCVSAPLTTTLSSQVSDLPTQPQALSAVKSNARTAATSATSTRLSIANG
ncbi:hypothetical protein BDR22DRAFT_49516 [Usnea florida]